MKHNTIVNHILTQYRKGALVKENECQHKRLLNPPYSKQILDRV
jgi:hypothetical protein